LESPYNPRADRSIAGVAQLVEQRIRNAKVVGSNPISGTIISRQATLQAHIEVHLQSE
tara:strand:- start:1524 stop:1697 length:174 start_codon:yes stop_codon:yes gene_type:complete